MEDNVYKLANLDSSSNPSFCAISIGFNPVYVIDVLKNMTDEMVAFEFSAPDKPAVLRSHNNYTYVIMPMQLG